MRRTNHETQSYANLLKYLRGHPILEHPLIKEIKYHTQIKKMNSYGPAYVTNKKHASLNQFYITNKLISEE